MSRARLFAISAALIASVFLAAACSNDDDAVPTPNVFQTIATVETSKSPDAPPPLPTIRLRNEKGLRDGERGSYCWPQPEGTTLCVDTIFLEGPPPPIAVNRGESLTVEIDAHAAPLLLRANVIEFGTKNAVSSLALDPALETELPLDVEPGVYTVTVSGGWDGGDIFYAFQVEVR